MTNSPVYSLANKLKFLVPSGIGLFLFVIPIYYNNSFTIPVGVLSSLLQSSLQELLPSLVAVTIGVSFILSLFFTLRQKRVPMERSHFFVKLFVVSPFWLWVRAIAAFFAFTAWLKLGFMPIASDKTGGMLLNELLPTIFCMFFTAGFLLSLLLDFGLLEFVGVLTSKVMRPFFTLPGRASIDCLASWLGDGTIGILLTNSQYVGGYYTGREAAVIATTFSFVSLSFSLVILAQLNLWDYIFPFYLTIVVVGLVCAVILPRIPPLSRKEDSFYPYSSSPPFKEKNEDFSLKRALASALTRASQHGGVKVFFRGGMHNVAEMWMAVLPVVMMFGTVTLLVAENTPVFKWLGAPFIPLLQLLRIPEADIISQAVVVGFADMFLPAVFASEITHALPRFVVATLSVSQLIFMSEVGGLILGSKIPINFKDLLALFLLRTLIALPIISLISHWIF